MMVRHSVRGVGDESAGVAENEFDMWVPAADPVAHKQIRSAGGIEQEVDGERWNAVHTGTRQLGRVNEHHHRTRIQCGEQIVLSVLAEVHPCRTDQVGP
jgi:hypothetical protein